jgi:hypothetical protein
VCGCSEQAAHYHNLGPKLGALLLTRHIGWKNRKKKKNPFCEEFVRRLVFPVSHNVSEN